MLAVTDLSVRYGMHEALTSVSLQVSRDEIVVILGANGAGKSTLLSAIAGNCVGDSDGRVEFDGVPLLGLDTAQVVEQGIAFVPEGRGVFADLTVEENLKLGSYAEHARRNEQQNLREVLSLFPKLEERKKQIVRTMSGGEQQMVAIGRALMSAPSILMLDEPSLGLSPLLCKELFNSLTQVQNSGVGILLVEQNAKQSLNISDRGYLLGNGKILGEDSAENLLNNSAVQSAYLGGAMASQTAEPIASAGKGPKMGGETTGHEFTGQIITPNISPHLGKTISSDSLLDEDVEALVSRASSSASHYRNVDASLPVQVVKLSHGGERGDISITHRAADEAAASTITRNTTKPFDLPETQDHKVQALLAEFEAAAKKAASGTSNRSGVTELTRTRGDPNEDLSPLPHIPVYKKSAVTVYRRDGSGKLRKQD